MGGSGSDDPFPDKRKGMHWRTHNRLRKKGDGERADFLGWVTEPAGLRSLGLV